MSGHLIHLVGMPGAGKTTLARTFVAERDAVHLDPDVWLVSMGLDPAGPRDRFEAMLFDHGLELLRHGLTVIWESQGWRAVNRTTARAAAQAAGATVELHVLDLPIEVRWPRVRARNDAPGAAHIDRAELERWDSWWEPVSHDERAAYDEVVVHAVPEA